jgi:hypothetical protein
LVEGNAITDVVANFYLRALLYRVDEVAARGEHFGLMLSASAFVFFGRPMPQA